MEKFISALWYYEEAALLTDNIIAGMAVLSPSTITFRPIALRFRTALYWPVLRAAVPARIFPTVTCAVILKYTDASNGLPGGRPYGAFVV